MLVPQVIYAGATPLATTLAVEQTGPLEITVRAGSFTTTGDTTFGLAATTHVLAADQAFTLTADPDGPKTYLLELGLSGGTVDVLARSRLFGEVLPDPPAGWETVHWLAELDVPAGATDLADVPVRVFTVLPGFPLGTTSADWQVQQGVVHGHPA